MRRRSKFALVITVTTAVAATVGGIAVATVGASTTTSPLTFCVGAKGALSYPGSAGTCPAKTSPIQVGSASDISSLAARLDSAEAKLVSPQACPSGQYVSGVDSSADLICTALPTASASPTVSPTSTTSGAPSAPTLTAVPGDFRGEIDLSWTSSPGATSYTLSRSTVSGTDFSVVTTTPGLDYVDSGLVVGTTYYYVVNASNVSGTSPNSVEASSAPQPINPCITC